MHSYEFIDELKNLNRQANLIVILNLFYIFIWINKIMN